MTDTHSKQLIFIQQQAAQWHAMLGRTDFTTQDSIDFKHWLEKDPEHELAYSQCLLVAEMTAGLIEDEDIKHEVDRLVSPLENRKKFILLQPQCLMKIAIALILTIGLSLAINNSYTKSYTTEVGEQRLVRLNDGSSVLLNTDTKISVRYQKGIRSITLNHGEAYFTVAKNPSRPFEVTAGTSLTRALGTQFSVALIQPLAIHKIEIDKDYNQVAIAVTEGIVEVEANTDKQQQVIAKLSVGDAITFSDQKLTNIPKVSPANIKRINAWQQRKIYFNNNTLAEAIAEYNRYSPTKFYILDKELEPEKISGLFNVGDIDAFIYSLEKLLSIEVVINNQRIFLTRKNT